MRWEPDELEDQIHEGYGRCRPAVAQTVLPARTPGLWNSLRSPMAGPDHDNGKELDMKSILDPSFRYTKSVDTDLRKTFARIRREQQKQAVSATGSGVVLALGRRKTARAAA